MFVTQPVKSQVNARQIAKAVDEEVVNRDLVPAFVKLLKDTEAEVRSAIAGQIPGMQPCRGQILRGQLVTITRFLCAPRTRNSSSRCYA